jgi:predicted nucleotidyltransferase
VSSHTIKLPKAFVLRRDRSTRRLEVARSAAGAFLDGRYPSLVVYVTGSVGRGEAGDHSDLDIFCVDVETDKAKQIGKLDAIQILGDLIKANQAGRFPPFSGDGRFLNVHNIEDVSRFLGTRDDDYRNLFTARMLLLLESQVLVGKSAYEKAVECVIDLYLRDYSDEKTFKPTFLLNDLVRYWRTLCLAHEANGHVQHERTDEEKRQRRVSVLKLQFNRVWMVFNGLAYLLSGFEGEGVSRLHIERLVELSPLDRALEIAERVPDGSQQLKVLLDEYSWFLEATDHPKHEIENFFADNAHYEEGRNRGRIFGDHMAELVNLVASTTPIQRHLLI